MRSLQKLFKTQTNVSNTRSVRQFVLITTELSLWVGYPCLLYPNNNRLPQHSKNINKVAKSSMQHLRARPKAYSVPFSLSFSLYVLWNWFQLYDQILFFPKHLQIVGIHLMSRCLILCFSCIVQWVASCHTTQLHFKEGIINFLMVFITLILMLHKQFIYFHRCPHRYPSQISTLERS